MGPDRGVADATPDRSAVAIRGRPRWLFPLAIAIYVAVTTWTQRVAGDTLSFPLAFAGLAAVILVPVVVRGRLGPVAVAAVLVIAASVLTDLGFAFTIRFSDLGIYLAAGQHLLDGQPVYQLTPLTAMPADYTTLPYLYPPPTIVLFAGLAALPGDLGGVLFVVGSVGLAVLALRCLGLSWPWTVAALAWPPIFNGIMSGNVSVALFGLFALAPRFGPGLVIAPLFKPYLAIAALWLVRERRFASIALGVAIVVVACLLTLPLVGGLGAWSDWLAALGAFAESEQDVRQLRGIGLERFFVPAIVVVAIAVAVTAVALLRRGRSCLARLGIATIVAQPTLYLHGFSLALSGLLELRAAWFWLAAATLSVAGPRILGRTLEWPGPWLAVLVVLAAWAIPAMRRSDEPTDPDETLHPLGRAGRLWPVGIDEAQRTPRPAEAPAPSDASSAA
jgi:hypothetical protein